MWEYHNKLSKGKIEFEDLCEIGKKVIKGTCCSYSDKANKDKKIQNLEHCSE